MPDHASPRTTLPDAPEARDGGLDALRAGAMLLGVLFHAAVPHTATPLRRLVWAVSETEPSRLLDLLFWAIHVFRMPLFFFLSGYFSVPALARRRPASFLSARLRRLGIPLLVPGLVVLVVLYYVWGAGWLLDGRCTLREIRAVVFADPAIRADFLGSAHLWFLVDLLVVSFLWTGARALGARPRSGRGLVAACAAVSLVLMARAPGIATEFRNGFLPDPARLAWHALFFAAGAALFDLGASGRRQREARGRRPGVLAAAIAAPALAAAYVLLPSVSDETATPLARSAFALAWSAAAWGIVLALFAAARGRTGPAGPRRTLLVEASLWVYLVHVPIVGAFQIALTRALPPVAVWALVSAGTYGASILSWLPLRRTALGGLLAWRRERR